jgi:hypothetical protein
MAVFPYKEEDKTTIEIETNKMELERESEILAELLQYEMPAPVNRLIAQFATPLGTFLGETILNFYPYQIVEDGQQLYAMYALGVEGDFPFYLEVRLLMGNKASQDRKPFCDYMVRTLRTFVTEEQLTREGWDMAVDEEHVFVTEQTKIVVLDKVSLKVVKEFGQGYLESADGLVLDDLLQRIFVSDHNKIVVFDKRTGAFLQQWAQPSRPKEVKIRTACLALDKTHLWKTDTFCVLKINKTSGRIEEIIGGYGEEPGRFTQAAGIAVNEKYFVVADRVKETNRGRVQVFSKDTRTFVTEIKPQIKPPCLYVFGELLGGLTIQENKFGETCLSVCDTNNKRLLYFTL